MQYKIPLFRPFIPAGLTHKVGTVFESGWIGEGPQVKKFEEELGKFINVADVVCTSSCTSAISIALQLAGVRCGDDVVSTPLTCVATNLPILACGAKIRWADIDRETGNICPESVKKAITPKTKAIMVVHWGGYPCDLDALSTIGHQYGLPVIEDAAHAFGSVYKGKRIGTHGDFTCFSFQSVKIISTGDGGSLICRNPSDTIKARQIRWFGIDRDKRYQSGIDSYDITLLGSKYHMNDIAATIGRESLRYIEELLETRRKHARCYREALANVHGAVLLRSTNCESANNYLFTALFENRDELKRKLQSEGVESSPVHTRNDTYSIFKQNASSHSLGNLDAFVGRMLCLPVGYWLKDKDVEHICALIQQGW